MSDYPAAADYLLQRAMLARLDSCRVLPTARDKAGNILLNPYTMEDYFRDQRRFKEMFGFVPTQEYIDEFFGRRPQHTK